VQEEDVGFVVPVQEEDKPKVAFTWEGAPYAFSRLPQGCQHSPTTAHNALAELQQIKAQEGAQIYQYLDGVLVRGEEESAVRITTQDIWNTLNEEGVEVPSAECQGPSKEVALLGTRRVAGQTAIPDETITKLDAISTPTTKTELQKIMGCLGYWRNHVPGFSIIARPFYTPVRKEQNWEWLDSHKKASQMLIEESKTYKSLGPVHPNDP
ncbi:POLY protein, partial [Machaerirhynchus nigripectus]|nr:POLY protein [Machaerirhynchus nigripectus]